MNRELRRRGWRVIRIWEHELEGEGAKPIRRHIGPAHLLPHLKAAGVEVDRRMLAELAVNDPDAFASLVGVARAAVPAASA